MSRPDPRPLLPSGLVVEAIEVDADVVAIAAHQAADSGHCPTCGGRSDWVHSLHRRRLLDVPSYGHAVELFVRVRRFRCAVDHLQDRPSRINKARPVMPR